MSWTTQLWNRPILKAKKKPIKKKELIRFKSPDGVISFIDQDVGEIHTKVKKEFEKWFQKCDSLANEDIGVVGKDAMQSKGVPKGKLYFDKLSEHLENHVTAGASRKGQEKYAFKDKLEDFKRLLSSPNELITDEDLEDVKEFTEEIAKFAGGKLDPKNIPFRVPTSVSPKEGGGEEGFTHEADDWDYVYGHYRTPTYVEHRLKAKGSKNELPVVDSKWYGAKGGSQTPPMHQAMFANSTKSKGKGELVETGLLGILEDFLDEIGDGGIDKVIIDFATSGTGIDMDKKAQQLADFGLFRTHVKNLMKKQSTYGGGNKANYVVYTGGPSRLIDNINSKVFNINRSSSKFITAIGGLEHIVGHENIETFQVRITAPLINRVINKIMREKNDFLAPNGKVFILSSAGGGRKYEGQSWSTQFKEAVEATKPKKEVKKSWVASLWK